MPDKPSVAPRGWIITVLADPRQHRGTAQMWIAMHIDAQEAIAVVRKRASSVSSATAIEAHQEITPSLAVALSLMPGQVKRFG